MIAIDSFLKPFGKLPSVAGGYVIWPKICYIHCPLWQALPLVVGQCILATDLR